MHKPCSVCSVKVTSSLRKRRCSTCQCLIEQAANRGTSLVRTAIQASVAEVAIRESLLLSRRLYDTADLTLACHYSHIPLVFEKSLSHRGDYVSFDHAIPNDASRAVLCSRITNDIKGWMTDIEFRAFIVNIVEADARRRIHGLNYVETSEFLNALRSVMNKPGSPDKTNVSRLKALSSKIHYRKATNLIDVQPNHLDGQSS